MEASGDLRGSLLDNYRQVAFGQRPEFIDERAGKTLIRMVDTHYTLDLRQHAWSLTAQDGLRLNFQYEQNEVTITGSDGGREIFSAYWHFGDPHAYKIRLSIAGNTQERDCDHNSFVPFFGELILNTRAEMPVNLSFRPFSLWFSVSDDFQFEVARRIGAHLPMNYFKALSRAKAANMVGCRGACFAASLATAAVPDPTDLIWWGLCLSCVGWGVLA